MKVTLNGDAREVNDRATICALLQEIGIEAPGKGIAVAVNASVVPRSEWSTTRLAPEDRVDIIHVVQGG